MNIKGCCFQSSASLCLAPTYMSLLWSIHQGFTCSVVIYVQQMNALYLCTGSVTTYCTGAQMWCVWFCLQKDVEDDSASTTSSVLTDIDWTEVDNILDHWLHCIPDMHHIVWCGLHGINVHTAVHTYLIHFLWHLIKLYIWPYVCTYLGNKVHVCLNPMRHMYKHNVLWCGTSPAVTIMPYLLLPWKLLQTILSALKICRTLSTQMKHQPLK